ncbi:glycosyltransferase involved in cell wall biosynthesis [Paraburkholderia sp. GAS41]|jgi:glycosyltransferase involved in cell wall biosynthesis|uniref:glycosyltransferase family 2 protein n=1 Tax=Paraburkholderia sp. GAS41 TaxID=3035134 RepID=UPI003D1DEB60
MLDAPYATRKAPAEPAVSPAQSGRVRAAQTQPQPAVATQVQPQFAVCVTTMNRADALAACLDNLLRCEPPPAVVVVSDDSPDEATRAVNEAIVAARPGAVYLAGPRRGVCANRNNAVYHCLTHTPDCTHVSFVDDDIQVSADFFAVARTHVERLRTGSGDTVILTGGASSGPHLYECRPVRLSFAGYFTEGVVPQCINLHASVFPLALFDHDRWDENIFFGTEDAELTLRALRRGYTIELVPTLRSRDTMPGGGVLQGAGASGGLTRYQVNCEAARLYIGVKRYCVIEPSIVRCAAFLSIYFGHLTLYLARHRALSQLVPIVRISNVWRARTAR